MEENVEVQKNLLKSWWLWALAALIIVLILFLWWSGRLTLGGSQYQAVFLSNNQVYFGKLSRAKSDYPVLRDVYYLQVTQGLQPQSPNQQLQLVKLGNEIHGPSDEMRINREHILFYENLKADSQVVRAIEAFKGQQK